MPGLVRIALLPGSCSIGHLQQNEASYCRYLQVIQSVQPCPQDCRYLQVIQSVQPCPQDSSPSALVANWEVYHLQQ